MSSPKFQNGDIAYLTWSPVPHRVLNTTTWVRDSGTVIEYGLVRPALGPDEPLDRSAEFPSLQELQSWPEDKLHRTRLAETSLLTVEEKVWASLQPLVYDAVYRPVLKSVLQKALQKDFGLKYGDRVRLRGTKREGFIVDGWHESWGRGSCWVTHVVFDDGGEEHRVSGLELVPPEEQGDPPPVLLRHCSQYVIGALVRDSRRGPGKVVSEKWVHREDRRERVFHVLFPWDDAWPYSGSELCMLSLVEKNEGDQEEAQEWLDKNSPSREELSAKAKENPPPASWYEENEVEPLDAMEEKIEQVMQNCNQRQDLPLGKTVAGVFSKPMINKALDILEGVESPLPWECAHVAVSGMKFDQFARAGDWIHNKRGDMYRISEVEMDWEEYRPSIPLAFQTKARVLSKTGKSSCMVRDVLRDMCLCPAPKKEEEN